MTDQDHTPIRFPAIPPADALSIVVDLFYLTAYNWAASQLVRNRSNRLCAITFGIAWSWAASRLVEPRAYLSGPEAQCKRDTPPPWACEELLAAIEAVPDRFAYERSLLGALHDVGHEPVPDDAQANPDTLATHVLPPVLFGLVLRQSDDVASVLALEPPDLYDRLVARVEASALVWASGGTPGALWQAVAPQFSGRSVLHLVAALYRQEHGDNGTEGRCDR